MRLFPVLAACSLALLPLASRAEGLAAGESVHAALTADPYRAAPEAHPEIRAAIRALERARVELQRASHDFGGHRTDALRSVDESIKQLRLALQYDRK